MKQKFCNYYLKFISKRYAYLLCYTLLFAIAASLTAGYFVLYHKTNIWQQDGLKQHYNALLYYGRYLKALIGDLTNGGDFTLPMWDDTIGYGSDIITTLHYYAIGDPLTLLSAIVPLSLMQYLYFGIYILRLYLGGLAFSWFSLWHGNKRTGTLFASMIYVFGAYSLSQCLMHSCFAPPLIYFPLILLGIDMIYEKKSPALFIVFTSIAALSNFYYFYMQAVLAAMYVFYRYARKYGRFELKSFLSTIGSFFIYGLNAFLISAVIFIPVLEVLFSSARWKAEKYVQVLYKINSYFGLLTSFVGNKGNGSGTLLGYTALALAAVTILVIKRKQYKGLFILFIVLSLFLMIPAAGFALNGFAYVSNRWVWGYTLLIAFVFAALYPELRLLSERERKLTAAALSLMSLISLIPSTGRNSHGYECAALMLLMAVLLLLVNVRKIDRNVFDLGVCVLLMIFIGINGYEQFSITADNGFIDQFIDSSVPDRMLTKDNADVLLSGLEDGDIYRINEEGTDSTQNSSIQRRVNTTGFYFSLTNPCISEFINDLYFIWPKDYDYEGTDNRAILDALAGVKYYMVKEGEEYKLPFDFDKKLKEDEFYGGRASLYTTDLSLPLGYTYDSFVTESDFKAMDVAKRQNALTQGAVVEDETVPALKELTRADTVSDAVSVLKSITGTGSVEIDEENRTILVRRGATVTFNIDGLDEAETYLVIKGLNFEGISEEETYDEGGWAGLTVFEKHKVKADDRYFSPDVTTSLRISAKDKADIVEYYTPRHIYYCGRHNFLTNMGYNKEGLKEITMTFRDPGLYSFEDLDVICQPVASIPGRLMKLRETGLKNVQRSVNSYSGTVNAKTPKIMVFSIPWSKGWRVYVDGKPGELFRANVMYMGVRLDAGEHRIELKYSTPGLKTGAACTLAGLVLLVLMIICHQRGSVFFWRRKGV